MSTKTGLLNLAEELGSVSQACRIIGISRDTFYRYQEAVNNGDVESLLNINRGAPNIKNRVDEATALKKKKQDDQADGEIESFHSGYLGLQDTFCVGTLKEVDYIYQQTRINTYSKIAFAKFYTTKAPYSGRSAQ